MGKLRRTTQGLLGGTRSMYLYSEEYLKVDTRSYHIK